MIPKVIHQIWIGDKRIPKHISEWMNEIRDAHPEFEYYLWHDRNLVKLPDRLQGIYDSLEHPAMKADLLRIYLCYTYGGIYLDADWKLISSLSQLGIYQDYDATFMYSESENIHDINNSFMGSVRYGYLFKHLLECITHEKQWLGPHWFGESIIKYTCSSIGVSHIELIDRCNKMGIIPLHWDTLNSKVIKHGYLASWYPNSEWNLKFESGEYE